MELFLDIETTYPKLNYLILNIFDISCKQNPYLYQTELAELELVE